MGIHTVKYDDIIVSVTQFENPAAVHANQVGFDVRRTEVEPQSVFSNIPKEKAVELANALYKAAGKTPVVDLAKDDAAPTEPRGTEGPARKSYGEIIEVALKRTEQARLQLRNKGVPGVTLPLTEDEKALDQVLNTIVAAVVMNGRGEKILRALVGE